MQTFSIVTLGCRVNHYESEQIAQVLRARGLTQVEREGDVRVIHTCSVTMHAAKDSRKEIRRATRLPVLGQADPSFPNPDSRTLNPNTKVIVTGCYATSDRAEAEKIPGVDAVITHHDDVNERLTTLLDEWSMKPRGLPRESEPLDARGKPRGFMGSLPLLHDYQSAHQRAFLKIQDGCDAHCTYCIIPRLRPALWSKPLDDTVSEARALVDAGHKEIVLTGIFLGAYGQSTALRRRQSRSTSKPIAELVEALCTRVPGLVRLRLSSLEPGDLDAHLIRTLAQHEQVVPHFHLPLQSGSDAILRKMNRQYDRTQFLEMAQLVSESFDRPAITTDIIVGFPGETNDDFAQTIDVANRVRFIHTHAFSYSPRPQTAAARWTDQFVHGPIVNDRINTLTTLAHEHSHAFRQQFLGQTVTVLTERASRERGSRERGGVGSPTLSSLRHGRSERYFDVHFSSDTAQPGDLVRVRIDTVTPTRTHGSVIR